MKELKEKIWKERVNINSKNRSEQNLSGQRIIFRQGDVTASLQRKIKELQYEIKKEKEKYNINISNNRQLKNQINELRKEKLVYDRIFNELVI